MAEKIPGVSFHSQSGRWRAYIPINGKRKYLGYFATQKEAAEHRALAEQEHPLPVKASKIGVQSQERGAAQARREVKPPRYDPTFNGMDLDSLSEDDYARATFDHNRRPSPDNIGRRTLPDETWVQWTAEGTIEGWFRQGGYWHFVRLGRTNVWDEEVNRLAELWNCTREAAHDVMMTGRRWRYLTYPVEAAHLSLARSLNVENLV